MSKVWIFNFFLLVAVVVAIVFVKNINDNPAAPAPIPVQEAKPKLEIVEQGESLYGYTANGETPPGESEFVYLTKAMTVRNPNDYPVRLTEVVNKTYDTEDRLIHTEDRFGLAPLRTIAPGEIVHIADKDILTELHFREDYGYSQTSIQVVKEAGAYLPFTELETKDLNYSYREADPGNTMLNVTATFANHSENNVDTSKLQFVLYFYDHGGKLIGGDQQTYITYRPERIRPGEEKEISFEGSLLGREFSKSIGSIEVFAGCDSCRA